MTRMINARCVQVAFLQGTTLFEKPEFFSMLCTFIVQCDVWSINLGEINLSRDKLDILLEKIKGSHVSFMFYECKFLPRNMKRKSFFKAIIANRKKHRRWIFSHDENQNAIIKAAEKNW